MNSKLKYKIISILLSGVFLSVPFFVSAEKKCRIDASASSGGNGSSEKPYKTINKALKDGCKNIEIGKGSYDEKITLGKNVKLKGDGNKTVLTERIKMDDNSKIEHIYVSGGGIEVLNDANATVKFVKITGARIGIRTVGGGKLTVNNCKIIKNKKGLYIQYGKKIDIKNNEVVENKEEGVDIRANVDGVIKNNKIDNNKEGGIEVIAGKSELMIVDNSLKNNTASGIAIQFYKSTKSLGALKIFGNILSGNGNYGIDCKIPSGGNPSPGYWSESVQFKYNKIVKNGKGGLSKFCKFSKRDILEGTKTEQEIDEMEKQEQMKKEKEKEITEKEIKKEKEKKQEEKRQRDEEKKRIEQREKDWELKKQVDEKLVTNFEGHIVKQEKYITNLKKEKSIKIFFLGIDENDLEKLAENLRKNKKILNEIDKLLFDIKTDDLKNDLVKQFKVRQGEYENSLKIYETYKNKFGLWPWFKKIF